VGLGLQGRQRGCLHPIDNPETFLPNHPDLQTELPVIAGEAREEVAVIAEVEGLRGVGVSAEVEVDPEWVAEEDAKLNHIPIRV
jgi:hypothetical protein